MSTSLSDIAFSQQIDSLALNINSLANDSTIAEDTIKTEKSTEVVLEDPVNYSAADSTPFDLEKQKLYLFNDAKVSYQDIELSAYYIEFNMETNELFAKGTCDSLGHKTGLPYFKQGEEEFRADTLWYNFKSKKGFIKGLKTEQEGGYLHSEITKRSADATICIKDGKYTTCDLDHPHYYIDLTKAKVIPDDKIVSGPAYLVIADVPTPIGIPFGFFPNQKKYTSGVLIPEYGEETNRGFFLRNGGYYFALSDYFDLSLRGDIYSRGTWGARMHTNYKKRYKFNGSFDIKFFDNVVGEKGLPNYSKSKDFSVAWVHRQDAKAHPGSSFSADVNLSSSSYDKNQTYSSTNYLNNTKSSSVSYSKSWGSDFNFSANLRHSQNNINKSVSLTLPSLNFNMNRQYPFRRKNVIGDLRWYEKIEISYKSKLENQINTGDSIIFTSQALDYLRNGFQQDIPLSANFKFFKFFTFTPSMKYTGRAYTKYFVKRWDDEYAVNDSTYGAVVVDTINKFKYVNDFSPSISLAVAPTVYGMYQLRSEKVKAIRHVMTPSVRFNYKAGTGKDDSDIWRPMPLGSDSVDMDNTYSIFTGSLYGSPISKNESGSVNLSIGNNLEMKVKSKKDTIDGYKKIKLIESLSFSSSYNIFKEENNWSNITMSGRTTLFKKMKITFGGSFDPYALDSAGLRTNNFEINENYRLGRLTSANFSTGFSFKPPKPDKSEDEESVIGDYNEYYVDFNVPWTLRVDYTFKYSKPKFESVITQTLRFSGDVKLTPNWKIGFSSGYDIQKNDFTYTSIDIYRDLHCWEARFTWIPFGYHQSYNFQINVKSSILKDLKWAKRKSWYDNF